MQRQSRHLQPCQSPLSLCSKSKCHLQATMSLREGGSQASIAGNEEERAYSVSAESVVSMDCVTLFANLKLNQPIGGDFFVELFSLPVSHRSTSLGRCAGIMCLPLESQRHVMEKQGGVIQVLLARRYFKKDYSKTDDRRLPQSNQCLLGDGATEKYRANVLVESTFFDASTVSNHAPRPVKSNHLSSLYEAILPDRDIKKEQNVRTAFQRVLIGLDKYLGKERGRKDNRAPYRGLLNMLHRSWFKEDCLQTITIGEFYKERLPKDLVSILVHSQNDYDSIDEKDLSPLTQDDLPDDDPLSVDDYLRKEQCASFLACLILIREMCGVFVSVVDGGHRVTTSIMHAIGFDTSDTGIHFHINCCPEKATLAFAQKPPRVRVQCLSTRVLEEGKSRNDFFEKAICQVLSRGIATATSERITCSLQEPVHDLIGLLLSCNKYNQTWSHDLDLSEATSRLSSIQTLSVTSTSKVKRIPLDFVKEVNARMKHVVLYCLQDLLLYNENGDASECPVLKRQMVLQGISNLTDNPIISNVEMMISPSFVAPSKQSKVIRLCGTGLLMPPEVDDEDVPIPMDADEEEDTQESNLEDDENPIDELRIQVFGNASLSTRAEFVQVFGQTDLTISNVVRLLEELYQGNQGKVRIEWDHIVMKEIVDFVFHLYNYLLASMKRCHTAFGIEKANEKSLALKYATAILFSIVPTMTINFIRDVGLYQDDLACIDSSIDVAKSKVPQQKVLTLKLLVMATLRPSEYPNSFPKQDVESKIAALTTGFLWRLLKGVAFPMAEREMNEAEEAEYAKNGDLVSVNANSDPYLTDLFNQMKSFLPSIIKSTRNLRNNKKRKPRPAPPPRAPAQEPSQLLGSQSSTDDQDGVSGNQENMDPQDVLLVKQPLLKQPRISLEDGSSTSHEEMEIDGTQDFEHLEEEYPIDSSIIGLPEHIIEKFDALWNEVKNDESIAIPVLTASTRFTSRVGKVNRLNDPEERNEN